MSGASIRADTAFDALAARLAARAQALAQARVGARTVERLLARRGDERRWRRADLVWPGFAKG